MNANVEPVEVPDDHTVCQGPCGEVFHIDDVLEVAGFYMCHDCHYNHPDVVRELNEDLKADMMSDDY